MTELPKMLEVAPRELVALIARDFLESGDLDNLADRAFPICAVDHELLELGAAQFVVPPLELPLPRSRKAGRAMRHEIAPFIGIEIDGRQVGGPMARCE